MIIRSIGHSNRSITEFGERLRTYNIERLIDIRTRPYSRFCPWFNRNSLSAYLESLGIAYDFRGENLGGLGENVNYDEALDELVKLAGNERVVIMCSEASFKKCHRHLMIEPELTKRNVEVEHILYV